MGSAVLSGRQMVAGYALTLQNHAPCSLARKHGWCIDGCLRLAVCRLRCMQILQSERCTPAGFSSSSLTTAASFSANYTFDAAPAGGAEELSPPRKSPSSPTLALFGSCGSQSHSSRQRWIAAGACSTGSLLGRGDAVSRGAGLLAATVCSTMAAAREHGQQSAPLHLSGPAAHKATITTQCDDDWTNAAMLMKSSSAGWTPSMR